MSNITTFIIAGGTGRQGGAAINALLNDPTSPVHPSKIYAITRNSNSPSSKALAARGIQLIQGDLLDSTAILTSVRAHGADLSQTGAFLAQAHGPQEVQQAKTFINAAVSSNLAYLVYSSVDRGGRAASDRDASYCKTFSDKFLIEKHLMAACSSSSSPSFAATDSTDKTVATSGLGAYTILRPTWFIDNAIWGFPGRLCMTGWRDRLRGKRMQVTCVADIGRWAALALLHHHQKPDVAAALRNQAVSIASDELSFAQADAIFREETGRGIEVANAWLTWVLVWAVGDLRTMFGWIDERAYGAEMEWLGRLVRPMGFREWVRENAVVKKGV